MPIYMPPPTEEQDVVEATTTDRNVSSATTESFATARAAEREVASYSSTGDDDYDDGSHIGTLNAEDVMLASLTAAIEEDTEVDDSALFFKVVPTPPTSTRENELAVSDLLAEAKLTDEKLHESTNDLGIAEGTGEEEDPPLPSYGFVPAITEKSEQITRSYPESQPSVMSRLHGALRRKPQRSATLLDGSSLNVVTTELSSDSEQDFISNPSSYSYSTGSMLKDTYTLMYVYRACPPTGPWTLGFIVFLFQMLSYGLLLSTLIDTTNPSNPLSVTVSVSWQMRIAQACSLLIAVVNSVDIVVALNNLLRVPSAIVKADEPGVDYTQSHAGELSHVTRSGDNIHQSFPTGMQFKIAVCFRLIEGALAIAASFVLIVQSEELFEMLANFAVLVFVVHLDNLAFALAEHGLIAVSLQEAARFVGGLRFRYVDCDARALKENRQGCTSNVGRLAAMRGNAIRYFFTTPLKWSQQNPRKSRRCTLIMMTLSLWAVWFLILSSLRTSDFLPKSVEVEFFHSGATASGFDVDGGLKPFVASRSGTYVLLFVDGRHSFKDTVLNMATGRSRSLAVAYRKIDPKAYPPALLNPTVIVPVDHQEILYYNPGTLTWVFATCDLEGIELMNIYDVHSACTGPQMHSIETDIMDITRLSTSAFRVVPTTLNAQEIELPVSISNNECGHQYGVRGSARADCGLGGGQCSDPQIDSGLRRTCICPQGVFGPFCTDFYAQSCPILNFRYDETVTDVPPAAAQLDGLDALGFNLLLEEIGVNNSPIWERRYMKVFYDRIEQRSGSYWTLTRHHESRYMAADTYTTLAIAEVEPARDPSSSSEDDNAIAHDPVPSGLTFYAPKLSSFGTLPDFVRPFAAYKMECDGSRGTEGEEEIQ